MVNVTTASEAAHPRATRTHIPDHAGEHVMRMIQGYWVSQICSATARLGLPDQLGDGARSLGHLAGITGADADGLGRLLRAAVTVGLFVETQPDTFELTVLGAQLRDGGQSGSLRDMAIALTGPAHWLPFGRLLDAGMSGRPQASEALGMDPWSYFADHPDERDHFARTMSTISDQASREVVRHYDVSRCRRIVDVGGSRGVLLAGLLKAAPAAVGVLFDLPGVVDGARAALAAANLADRIELVGGDFFEAVPADGDLYLLKSILHDWDDEHALGILRNVHRASQPGTRMAIVERLLPSEPGPSHVHLQNLLMLVELGGRERTREDYADLLDQAGFAIERSIATSASAHPWTIIEAVRQ
jgi:hypothetical protein